MSGINIPELCGVILLPDTVLFPHGALPLHIFEERYREMLEDSLEGDCMICVGTLVEEESNNYGKCVHPIGTVGLIRTSREMEDGRSNLVLHGVYRVRFSAWPGGKRYPYAHIVPMSADPFPSDKGPAMANKLRAKVNEVLTVFPDEVKHEINQVLDRAHNEPAILADAISQQFVQDSDIRLQILGEPSLDARYELLFRYLTMIRDNWQQN